MEAWFISDIHLKTAEERNGQILLRFLRSLLEKNPKQVHLFMLGDIFDLWIGPSEFFARRFPEHMQALKDLIAAGGKVTFIEGNHDVHVEKYFEKKLGVKVFVEAQYFQIDNLKVRVEHGDLINLNDEKYLKYRAFIRNPRYKFILYMFPGWLWNWAGTRASKKSRDKSGEYRARNEAQLLAMIRKHTERAYQEEPFDVIVSGHMHVFDDHMTTVNGKPVRTVNLGSWFEEKVRVFHIKDGQCDWVVLN